MRISLGETHEDCSWLSGKNLFTKMTGLAINGPPEFLDYGTFLCRDQLCYQRVCEHTGHTSRSPAYSDKVYTHWDFQITARTVETIFMDKSSSKRHVKTDEFLVRKTFEKKSGAKKPIFFHETGSTAHPNSIT